MKNNIIKLILFLVYCFLPIISAIILFFFETNYFSFIHNQTNSSFYLYDNKNNIIENYYYLIEYKKIPKNLVHAFISIEDTDFFNHNGFSIKAIIRSFWYNIKKKSFAQGGSTITQQYVKLHRGDLKKTFSRKLKELCIAIILEFCYTKEEIFQSYCNILYFGKNIIGIAECARILFNKKYSELSLSECAMMAGIVQRPEYYNPIKNQEAAIKRKNLVLKTMLRENYITNKQYENAILDNPIIVSNNFFNYNKSILQTIEIDLKKLNFSLNHEYKIFTSIDSKIQKIASDIFNYEINKIKNNFQDIEGSIIISNYRTGKIISIINGYNLIKNKNTVFEWKKQIGSIIKPYIMYYALSNGDTIYTKYNDEPLESIFKWNPKNNNKKFKGETTIENALFQSNNIIPIRIIHKYGINNFINLIQIFFNKKINPYLSLALGCIEASPFEIANIFNTFLNDGAKLPLTYIEKIIKKSGGIVYVNKKTNPIEIFNSLYIKDIKLILNKIGSHLAKKNNIEIKSNIYAKTGTTNDAVSCWFVCANETYSIIICLGTDLNIKLSQFNIKSINTAAPIGLKILKAIDDLS